MFNLLTILDKLETSESLLYHRYNRIVVVFHCIVFLTYPPLYPVYFAAPQTVIFNLLLNKLHYIFFQNYIFDSQSNIAFQNPI